LSMYLLRHHKQTIQYNSKSEEFKKKRKKKDG